MLYSTALLLPLLASMAAAHAGDHTHAVTIFTRHGDRTWKGAPPTKLTALGQNQVFSQGQYWRSRYLSGDSDARIDGINEDTFDPAQLSASAPDQTLLVNSAQSFLQGLYPPVQEAGTETLANGTEIEGPLNGYQYIPLHTVPEDSASTLWLKGDDACPAYLKASKLWTETEEFKSIQEETAEFYQSFYDRVFAGVLDQEDMGYQQAYSIFDYVNVGYQHNATIRDVVKPAELDRLRVLADSAEYAQNSGELGDAKVIGGRTLAGKFLNDLTNAITVPSTKQKMSVQVGSYDTFLAFFSITGLSDNFPEFKGLPDYASSIALEVFSTSGVEELQVRFLIRNGTSADAKAREYPLFGRSPKNSIMSWSEFNDGMKRIALLDTAEWCDICGNESEAFCMVKKLDSSALESVAATERKPGSSLTPAVAGVVGAMVTLGAMVLVFLMAMVFGFRLKRKQKVVVPAAKEFDEGSLTSA